MKKLLSIRYAPMGGVLERSMPRFTRFRLVSSDQKILSSEKIALLAPCDDLMYLDPSEVVIDVPFKRREALKKLVEKLSERVIVAGLNHYGEQSVTITPYTWDLWKVSASGKPPCYLGHQYDIFGRCTGNRSEGWFIETNSGAINIICGTLFRRSDQGVIPFRIYENLEWGTVPGERFDRVVSGKITFQDGSFEEGERAYIPELKGNCLIEGKVLFPSGSVREGKRAYIPELKSVRFVEGKFTEVE